MSQKKNSQICDTKKVMLLFLRFLCFVLFFTADPCFSAALDLKDSNNIFQYFFVYIYGYF